jgi:Fe-S cluster biogenesis protein NfuA
MTGGPGVVALAGVVSRPCVAHRSPRSPVVDTDKVSEVIEVIRPAIQADGGDIFLRGVDADAGVVTVELVGACVSCPASTVTLKAGIERILKDRVPGVTEVVDVGAPTETSVGLGL